MTATDTQTDNVVLRQRKNTGPLTDPRALAVLRRVLERVEARQAGGAS